LDGFMPEQQFLDHGANRIGIILYAENPSVRAPLLEPPAVKIVKVTVLVTIARPFWAA
jgi:hypothetical protein